MRLAHTVTATLDVDLGLVVTVKAGMWNGSHREVTFRVDGVDLDSLARSGLDPERR